MCSVSKAMVPTSEEEVITPTKKPSSEAAAVDESFRKAPTLARETSDPKEKPQGPETTPPSPGGRLQDPKKPEPRTPSLASFGTGPGWRLQKSRVAEPKDHPEEPDSKLLRLLTAFIQKGENSATRATTGNANAASVSAIATGVGPGWRKAK